MPHQALTPVRQPQAPHPGQEGLGFRLNGLGQQPAGAAPQDGRERGVDRLRLMQRDNGAIACHRRIAPSGGPGRLCHPPRYAALLTPPAPSFGHSSPENRLVVRTLEQRWEAALAEEVRVKAEHERFLAEQPLPLTRHERAAIEQLASDIPSLWRAATTTAADQQAIARLMLERVVVAVQGDSEAVRVECHWAGGTRTQHDLRRPVGRLTQLRDYQALLARVRDLHAEGHKAAVIAEMLNTERWRPPKRRATYNAPMVLDLLHRIGVPVSPRRSLAGRLESREPDELTISELAALLATPQVTVHSWVTRAVVTARQAQVGNHGLWLIRVNEAELNRLRKRRNGRARLSVNPHEA